MVKRLLIYGFPFFLLLIEALLRNAYHLNSQKLMGPALAATGAAALLPLTTPKKRNDEFSDVVRGELQKKKAVVVSRAEQRFIDAVWLFVFIFIGSWAYTVYLASQTSPTIWLGFDGYLVLGFGNYFGSIVFSELKEVL